MNEDQVQGEVKDVGGKVEETAGDIAGDGELQRNGLLDQLAGKLQRLFGTVEREAKPVAEKARKLAKERPVASAAVAGVIGLALLNTLRGRRRRKGGSES
jgi:uncharacterized protein YjbJ (UPF0337 family)